MPDDMSDMIVIRNELSHLRQQFNSLLNTVKGKGKGSGFI